MAPQRRRSEPPSRQGPPSHAQPPSPSHAQPPSPSHAQPPAPGARLLAQADALAHMSVELSLHAVSTHAQRLEAEMHQLAARAGHDAEFLRAHQQRLHDMWNEVVAVKLQADSLGVAHGDLRAQFVRCRRETRDFRVRLRAEMQALRTSVDDLACQLDGLPSAADLDDDDRRAPTAAPARTDCPSKPPRQRIHEAIQSTRRWYRDHKTTGLSDAAFVANYLRQQSKRDPVMAVLLQKALQRLGRRNPRPRSLDDLCRDLSWSDVTDTVKAVLVRDTEAAARALEREDRAAAACQARR